MSTAMLPDAIAPLRPLRVALGHEPLHVDLAWPRLPLLARMHTLLQPMHLPQVSLTVALPFSEQALRARIVDAGCKVVLTADEGVRARKSIRLKAAVDKALEHSECPSVTNVLVHKRTGGEVEMRPGRDIWLHEAMSKERSACSAFKDRHPSAIGWRSTPLDALVPHLAAV